VIVKKEQCAGMVHTHDEGRMTKDKGQVTELHLGPGIPAVGVLYCDGDLLVVNKPAGLLSVPDRWQKERPNLMQLLQAAIKKPSGWAVELKLDYVANAHRLDFDTSGVFVIARSRESLAKLVRQFRGRDVRKSYVALVQGRLPDSPLVIDEPILPDPRRRGLAMISRRGRPSVSRAETVETFRGLSLVRVWPETGRLHQVRIHLKAAGCPIIGDRDYGSGEPLYLSDFKRKYSESHRGERPLLARMALHAESIELAHPGSGQPLRVEAPMPRDIAATIKQLGKYALAS